jgi:hypothetical protein
VAGFFILGNDRLHFVHALQALTANDRSSG